MSNVIHKIFYVKRHDLSQPNVNYNIKAYL
jgi:hypothetical protein